MYKKIALVCATIATAGLLMTGCSKKGDTELRREVFEELKGIPEMTYTVSEGNHVITTEARNYIWCDGDLKITITNKITDDTLSLRDNNTDGNVDIACYNGLSNGTEGMDERFDEALRKVKPSLDLKIQQEVQRVKENTKLK